MSILFFIRAIPGQYLDIFLICDITVSVILTYFVQPGRDRQPWRKAMKEIMRKREEKIRAFHRMTAEEDLWGIYEFCQRDRRLTVLWKDMCEYASVYHRHAVRPLARKFKEGRGVSEAEKIFYLYLQAEFL
ncbi:MAG: hypothetical protein WDZ82_00245, partial [Candidatus Paceibacterota bacterium]